MLWRLRRANQRWRMYSHLLLGENRWRAMRYSYDAGLLDLGQQRVVPFAELLEEMIALVAEDAAALGCSAEIARLREIMARGTSAHRQTQVYDQAIGEGATTDEALRAVVNWLVAETAR
jgi:carboxylate-amine ligase